MLEEFFPDRARPEPVVFEPRFGAWVAHGYAEANRVLTEHELFSSDELRHSAEEVPHRDNPVLSSLMATDPPRHHVLRRIISRAFTPRAVEALIPGITGTVREMVDRYSPGADLIAELAYPLPVAVIAGVLGVRAELLPEFVRWTEAITSFAGAFAEDPARQLAFKQALAELGDYFRTEFARQHEGDVIGTLLAAEPDGSRLTEEELVNFCALLLINGHETTRTWLVNSALCLLRHPEAVDRLRAQPHLLPTALEEVLRYLPPTGGVDRFATRDILLGGKQITTGQRVIAMLGTANRDPAVFADADTFDVARTPNPHLSFGHGIHFCLGAHLARRQLLIALRELLPRLRWELDGIRTERTPVGVDVLALRLR